MSPDDFEHATDVALQTILDNLKHIVEEAQSRLGATEPELAILVDLSANGKGGAQGSTRARLSTLLNGLRAFPQAEPMAENLAQSLAARPPPNIPILFIGRDEVRVPIYFQLGWAIYSGGMAMSAGGEA